MCVLTYTTYFIQVRLQQAYIHSHIYIICNYWYIYIKFITKRMAKIGM